MDRHTVLRKRTAVMTAGYLAAILYDRDDIADTHIGCAGHDLKRLIRTDIYLTNDELVGIRMLFDGEDLSGHDFLKIFIKDGAGLDLRTSQGHRIRPFLRCTVKIRHIRADPVHGCIHCNIPLFVFYIFTGPDAGLVNRHQPFGHRSQICGRSLRRFPMKTLSAQN